MGKINKRKRGGGGGGGDGSGGGGGGDGMGDEEESSQAMMRRGASYIIQEHSLDGSQISSNDQCCTKDCCLHYLRKVVTFLISRVGLMIIVIGYILGGGYIIQEIEKDYEERALNLSAKVLKETLARIYQQIELNTTRVKDFTFYTFLKSEIRTFSDFYINATRNGTLTGHVEKQWDYFGSVFYCVTLISTIGYGHITCKTKTGKVFTIIYSAIGVPLMMLFLANIGSSTATLFKFIYLRAIQCKRKLRRPIQFFRSTRTDLYDDYYDPEMDEFDPANNANNNYNDIDGESSNKEAFYRDSAIFGGPGLTTQKLEASAFGRSKPEFVTFTVGLRDIEVERSQMGRFLDEFRIPVMSLRRNDEPGWPPRVDQNSLRLVEAIKKIDNLLDKENANRYETESIDRMMSSFEEFGQGNNSSQMRANNIKFQINSDDEDDEYTNVDYGFDDEPEPNQNYLISSIFSGSNSGTMNRGGVKKRNSQKNTTPESQSVQPIGQQKKEETKLPVPVDTSRRKSSDHQPRLKKQAEFSISDTSSIRLNKQHSQRRSKQMPPKKTTARKLVSVYSSPGFGAELLRHTPTTRSVYSYEYPPTQQDDAKRRGGGGGSGRRVSRMMPFYNEKQLGIIYKQMRQQKRDKLGVPMLTTVIIMPTYLIAGMLIFSSFEDWRRLDALYFCFTTLTTIGFGDFIPTRSTLLNKNNGNKNNLYISALYIFVGLILIAMCINLVKNQIKLKIKSFAKRIGLANC